MLEGERYKIPQFHKYSIVHLSLIDTFSNDDPNCSQILSGVSPDLGEHLWMERRKKERLLLVIIIDS